MQPAATHLLDDALHDLRREVELGPLPMLSRLAQEAIALTDVIFWTALEQGNVRGFCRYANSAVALRDFTVSTSLLP